MKKRSCLLAFLAPLTLISAAIAQAPAGSTGICKDGTYTQSASKSGACRGHQGVKEWYAAAPAAKAPAAAAVPATPAAAATQTPAATPSAAAKPAAAATPATAASGKMSPQQRAASMTQAPGGGPGMVWVNSESNVYHCPGSTFYGKTKKGQYMSEADAKAKGAHADHNHACSK